MGAPLDDDGGGSAVSNLGAVWICYLNADGTVASTAKISALSGNFHGDLDLNDQFGWALSPAGDVNRDGIMDLAVTAPNDWNQWGFPIPGGAVWILHMRAFGAVQGWTKLSPLDGNLDADLFAYNSSSPLIGRSIGLGSDYDGDGRPDLLIGMIGDDYGQPATHGTTGSAFIVSLSDGLWVDLGHALAGSQGEPNLLGDGEVEAGNPVTVTLRDGPSDGLALLVVGLDDLYLPLNGGTLVPALLPGGAGIFALPLDAGGDIVIPTPWPAGIPDETTLWLQAWMADAAAPFGWSATNGLATTTP